MNKRGAYQPPLASQHGHLHMAEGHPALVHEVAMAEGGRRDPRRDPQHKTAATPVAAAGGRACRQASVGNGRKGCTMSSNRGDRPSNPNRLFSCNQRGKGRKTHVYPLTHIFI